MLLEKPGRLFLSPNGHGGTLTALAEGGILDQLRGRDIDHVFYFQVDNPLVKICDPGFLGRHIGIGSEVSSKVVLKEKSEEKVGVLAVLGEVTCLVTAIVVLPAVLLLVRPQASPRLPAFEWDKATGAPTTEVLPPGPRPEVGP